MIIDDVEYLDPYKENPTDQIYWLETKERMVGEILFSFDLKNVYSFFIDYPHNLTKEEVDIFKKENAELASLKEV